MTANRSLFVRDDTFFGVCEALGQDFGFSPVYLRVAFAVPFLWNPAIVVAAYLALGLAVAASRLLFPVKAAATESAGVMALARQPAAGNNDQAFALAA